MQEVLEDIGLSRNESKAYLALLELGCTSAGRVARKARLDRANIYDSLEKLEHRGLVSCVLKNGTKHFEAAKPGFLTSILKQKEQSLQEILPRLKLLSDMNENKSEAHVYTGLKAFINVLDNFLTYNEPVLVYGIPENAPEMMKFFIPHFHRKRIPRKIEMKHLYNFNAGERMKYLNSMPYTQARHLPREYDSNVSTNICGDEVVLVLWEKTPITIRVKNRKIADVYKKYFELLWKEGIK